MRTLLVQADSLRRRTLLELLRDRGHEVVCRESVDPALSAFAAASFDLVIVDLALPRLDCPNFCRRLRAEAAGAWCVLVVLTAGDWPRAIAEALHSGADDYLVSTDDPELLRVDVVVAERRVEANAARRRVMGALTESETGFRDLLQNAPDAILRIDADGRIGLMNGQAARIFGYLEEELLGQPVEILLPESYRAAYVGHRARYLERPQTRPMATGLTLSLRRKDGSELPADVCLGRHRTGGQDYVVAVVRDVTERRRMEEEIWQAKEDAKHAYERIHDGERAAARLQRAFLPANLPAVRGIRFACDYYPGACPGGVGLNVFRLDEDHVGLYLLDVSGHGVAAVLLSVTLGQLLSSSLSPSRLLRVPRPDGKGHRIVPPAEVAGQLNRWLLTNQGGEQFFTLFYGILEVRARRLRYVSAGHPGLLHVSAGSGSLLLRPPGYPIGCMDDAVYEEGSLQLKPGDRLCLYSDGFTDVMNPAGEPFGLQRLRRTIESAGDEPVDACVRRLSHAALEWAEGVPRDDLSVLALAVERL
jgi:sigma-B regulation protein RsbU (phosphoserine phosphatase)